MVATRMLFCQFHNGREFCLDAPSSLTVPVCRNAQNIKWYTLNGKVGTVRVVKAYRGSRGIAPLILHLGADAGELSTTYPGRFTPWEELRYPFSARPAGRNGLVVSENRKTVSCPCRHSNLGPLSPYSYLCADKYPFTLVRIPSYRASYRIRTCLRPSVRL
jgi:hypothetical protein